jgi:hypothetical protein
MSRPIVAYLSSEDTMPGSSTRRDDGFEHDFCIAELGRGLHSIKRRIEPVRWDAPNTDWSRYEAAIIGTTWDYTDRAAEFIAKLQSIEAKLPLLNSAAIVAWNARKTYLRDLEQSEIATIPTLWLNQCEEAKVRQAFVDWNCDSLVIKPQIGANAWRQVRLQRDQAWPSADLLPPDASMVQPFMPSIQSEGEISFLFFNRVFSHAVIKTPAGSDYRIQSSYGGVDEVLIPTSNDLTAAQKVIDAVKEPLLYARVDMVRDAQLQLRLIELELIEPYLYARSAPQMAGIFAKAYQNLVRV